MKRAYFAWIVAGMLLAAPQAMAQALDLDSARSAGKVCEQADGYARAVALEAQALVAEVNGRRRQEYARISGQNKQPADVVAKLAAQQILKKPGVKLCP